MQGTKKDLYWFRRLLERQGDVDVKSVSEPFANKGTKKYFRVYAEVRAGKKVLLVEADAQGSMAVSLGIAEPDMLPFPGISTYMLG